MKFQITAEVDGVRTEGMEVEANSHSEAMDKLYKKRWWTFGTWNILRSFFVFSGPKGDWAEVFEISDDID
jgi:hypothetical protein